MKTKFFWHSLTVTLLLLFTSFSVNAQWLKQQVTNPLDSSFRFYPSTVKFADANTGYLAGTDYSFGWYPGIVFKTTNGGNNWNQLTLNIAYKIWDLEVVNPTTVYAACDSAQVIKTLTGGNTWTVLSTPAVPSLTVRWRISFINALTGWITSDDALMSKTYQTTNGGNAWTSVNASAGFSKLKFVSASNGFGMNSSGFYATTNGGVNWTNTLPDSLLTEFYFLNNSTGWLFSKKSVSASSIKGKSWKTTNGGLNWSQLYANDTTGRSPSNVNFFDDLTGYANYYVNNKYPSGIIKTTDGGINWFNPTNYRLVFNERTSFSMFLNQSTGWYGTEYDYLYKTNTGPGNLVNPFFADYYKYQNSNNISNYMDAHGRLTGNPNNGNLPGFEYPKGSGNSCLFTAAIVIGAQVNGETRVSQSYNGSDFSPGKFDGAGNETGSRLAEYGLYQIKTGDGTGVQDWDNWPVSQGAPFSNGQPQLTGNLTTFISLTDAIRTDNSGEGPALNAEVKITSYAFNDELRKDAIYYKLDITNKSNSAWNNAYVSFYIDSDIGASGTDDKMGCDSTLGLAYCYNGLPGDPGYGPNPPACGYKFISGTSGFNLSSCIPFYNSGTPPPNNCWTDPNGRDQFYNMQKGLDKCGDPFFYEGLEQKYVYSGDPETGEGWNTTFLGDARFMMSAGPGNLSPGQTATVIVAVLVGRGNSAKNSVTKLKQFASILPLSVLPVNSVVPDNFKLNQNYPNPFNPVTKISYSIPKASFLELNVYDMSGRLVKNLFSGRHAEGNYEMDFNGESLASGVYICRMNSENYTNSIKMILVK